MSKMDYKNMSRHVQDLAQGQMLAPGEIVTLEEAQADVPHNALLISEGVLVSLPIHEKSAKPSKEDAKEGVKPSASRS